MHPLNRVTRRAFLHELCIYNWKLKKQISFFFAFFLFAPKRRAFLLVYGRRSEQKNRRHSNATLANWFGCRNWSRKLGPAFHRPDALNDRQFQRTLRERTSFVGLACACKPASTSGVLITLWSIDRNLLKREKKEPKHEGNFQVDRVEIKLLYEEMSTWDICSPFLVKILRLPREWKDQRASLVRECLEFSRGSP